MWDLLKKYFILVVSSLTTSLISWLVDFNSLAMNKVQSFISLFLTIFVAAYVIEERYGKFKKRRNKEPRKKSLGEKIVSNQKQVKFLTQSIDPEEQVKELCDLFEKTRKEFCKMTKFINFWKDLFRNKATYTSTALTILFAVISQVATYTGYLYNIPWCAEHELIIKICSPILAVFTVFVQMYTTWTKYGRESALEYAERKAAKLSKEEKKKIKTNIEILSHSLESLTEKHSKALEFISSMDTLLESGYSPTHSESLEYQDTKANLANLEKTVESLKTQIASEKAKL